MFKNIALISTIVLGLTSLAEACPTGLRELKTVAGVSKKLDGKTTCILENEYKGSTPLKLDASFSYILNGGVFIGIEKRENDPGKNYPLQELEGGALEINAGVKIFALNPKDDVTGVWDGILPKKDSDYKAGEAKTPINMLAKKDFKPFLAVTRDSSIQIKGTAMEPVIMTSAQGQWPNAKASVASPAPGDWGGLIINGYAKTNLCYKNVNFKDCNAPGEAGTGWYGGNNDAHNAGIIQYLQIEFGGDQITDKKQYNGLTLNGIGVDTVLENIAILHNNDDSIEFFGGAAIVKNLFAYKQTDDGVDTTEGARVYIQNGVVVAQDFDTSTGAKNDRYIVEADSAADAAPSAVLRSFPVLHHFTFIGATNSQGLRFRRGTDFLLENSIMFGFDIKCWAPHKSAANKVELNANSFSGCNSADETAMDKLGLGQEFLAAKAFNVNAKRPWELMTAVTGAKVYDDDFFPLPGSDAQTAYINAKIDSAYEDVDTKGSWGGFEWVKGAALTWTR